jgi:hypothetical protein
MNGTCFVISPFGDPYNQCYNEVFLPALNNIGLKAIRADKIYNTGPIMNDIFSGIINADLIICDVTGRNPNVNYELGVAHAFEKPTIIVTQDLKDAQLPFNYHQHRAILYDISKDNWTHELELSITETIRKVLKDPYNAVPWRLRDVDNDAQKKLAVQMGVVRTSEFEFYPNRNTMTMFRNLNEIIQEASEIKMILVGGSALIEKSINCKNIKKVILPHPYNKRLNSYAESVKDVYALKAKIESVTSNLASNGVDVRWYPEMLHHTIIIADIGLDSGWVQWESVLPYGPLDKRPCVVIHEPKYKNLIKIIDTIFEEILDASVVSNNRYNVMRPLL